MGAGANHRPARTGEQWAERIVSIPSTFTVEVAHEQGWRTVARTVDRLVLDPCPECHQSGCAGDCQAFRDSPSVSELKAQFAELAEKLWRCCRHDPEDMRDLREIVARIACDETKRQQGC